MTHSGVPTPDAAATASDVDVYRTLDDLDAIRDHAQGRRTGTVIGGGLLGLEAVNALHLLGLDTHLVEFAPAPVHLVRQRAGHPRPVDQFHGRARPTGPGDDANADRSPSACRPRARRPADHEQGSAPMSLDHAVDTVDGGLPVPPAGAGAGRRRAGRRRAGGRLPDPRRAALRDRQPGPDRRRVRDVARHRRQPRQHPDGRLPAAQAGVRPTHRPTASTNPGWPCPPTASAAGTTSSRSAPGRRADVRRTDGFHCRRHGRPGAATPSPSCWSGAAPGSCSHPPCGSSRSPTTPSYARPPGPASTARRTSWWPTPRSACAAGWRRPTAGAWPSRCAAVLARGLPGHPGPAGHASAAGSTTMVPVEESYDEVIDHLRDRGVTRSGGRHATAR